MNHILLLDAHKNALDAIAESIDTFAQDYQVERYNALELSPEQIKLSSLLCLLILDGQLPNYLEYLHTLKRKENISDSVPVLLCLPSDATSDTVAHALSKGVTDFIIEPWSAALVEARVKSNLKLFHSQKALEKQKTDLRELTETQNYLMSIVAHDLKAPLNRVQGLVQLLPLVGTLNQEQKEQVEMIEKAVESGQKLIEDILTINAYEADCEPLYIKEIELSDFIKETISMHQQSIADKKNIQISFEQDTPITLKTDSEHLTRILDNLISNALKFSPKDKKVFINLEQHKNQVIISVKDQGPGISPEDQKKMFKKFQKLSAKPTGGETSTGLGLSIIKVLTQRLQGSIDYDTILGKGTTFKLKLPSLD